MLFCFFVKGRALHSTQSIEDSFKNLYSFFIEPENIPIKVIYAKVSYLCTRKYAFLTGNHSERLFGVSDSTLVSPEIHENE